jgi:beta-barrel assembly-enhancing protease
MSRILLPFPGRARGRYPQGPSDDRGMFGSRSGSSFKFRLMIALAIALFAILAYFLRGTDENKVTGNKERVALPEEAQEVQMGLAAVPEMAQMHGGRDPNEAECQDVERVGQRLLVGLDDYLAKQGRTNPYRDNFRFTLLADPQTVNAFALPGGQIFITKALYRALETHGQLAGVLAHEIGHVIERHGNKRMAKEQLFQGLAAAGGVAGGSQQSAQMAQAVAGMVSMKYGRDDELESDMWAVRLTAMAGYDPRSMIGVMAILDQASRGAAPPEILSTHPKPANRVAYIKRVIDKEFPNGVPNGLEP